MNYRKLFDYLQDQLGVAALQSEMQEIVRIVEEMKKEDNTLIPANSESLSEWDLLDEQEGEGSYCCGKRMVLAPSGIVYECLKCGGWEYSSS